MLSMQIELIVCRLLKVSANRSVVSTPQLCTLAEWYSLKMDDFLSQCLFTLWLYKAGEERALNGGTCPTKFMWGSVFLQNLNVGCMNQTSIILCLLANANLDSFLASFILQQSIESAI